MSIAIKQTDISDYTVVEVVGQEETQIVPENAGAVVIVKGKDGENGKDGISPDVEVEKTENGHRVTITDKDGTESFDIPNGGGSVEVTAESIVNALGYTPADEKKIPTVPTKLSAFENDKEFVDESRMQKYAQPKGDYALKSEIPTVPKKISELENDAGYAKKSELPTVPTKTSELTNDSGFITEDDIPEIPVVQVQSVNGQTGAVQLSAEDVGARSDTWLPEPEEIGAKPASYNPTYSDVGADKAGTAEEKVGAHNVDPESHQDIRISLEALIKTLEAFLDMDDSTYDQLSELVQKIEANAGSVEQLTNGKVNVSDIINNLTTNVSNKPLSAAQGVALKALIDDLVVVANNATTTASGAKTTAEEAKTAAQNAGTIAGNAKTTAENAAAKAQTASDDVAEMQERMDSGEFKGDKGDPGYTPQKDVDYFDGKNGTSVTVKKVTESTESGGTNTVEFSDGKKVNIKNGINGKDYVLTEADKTEIVQAVYAMVADGNEVAY